MPRCHIMDVLVHNAFEGTGLGVWFNMAVFERCPLIFEVGANANSLGVIDRLYQRLLNRTCYAYPLHVGQYVRAPNPHSVDAALRQTLLDGTRWFVTDANTDKDRP